MKLTVTKRRETPAEDWTTESFRWKVENAFVNSFWIEGLNVDCGVGFVLAGGVHKTHVDEDLVCVSVCVCFGFFWGGGSASHEQASFHFYIYSCCNSL